MAISIDFELTNRCNASCHFCPRDRTPHQGLMSVEVFERGLARAVDYRELLRAIDVQEPMVSLCGLGEPLLNKHAATFARQVRDQGFTCAMSSNAALLDERRGRELLDAGLNQILINAGERGEDYEAVYKLPWAKTRDNIVRFREMAGDDCEVLIVLVNHRRDDEHQAEMREFWSQHGVGLFHEYEIMNRGGSLFVDEMQYDHLAEVGEAEAALRAGGDQPFCIAPFLGFFIGYDGNYYLCCADWEKTVPVGSVFDTDFVDTIKAKLQYVSSRSTLCQTCNHEPVNVIADQLRGVAAGEVERSSVDELVLSMRGQCTTMLDGMEQLVPGLRASIGESRPGRRLIPVSST